MTDTIIKRDGREMPFDEDRITLAVMKCMTNGVGLPAEASGAIAERITDRVINVLKGLPGVPSVERIQDLVEQQLMAEGEYEAARAYILYREHRSRARELIRPTLDPEDAEKVRTDLAAFEHPLQVFQTLGKYARWNEAKSRRETWPETVDRAIDYLQQEVGTDTLTSIEWGQLRQHTLRMEALPSMRLLQMAGPAALRCNVSIYNCLSRETAFVTSAGVKTFQDFNDGDEATVLSHTGQWRKATVRCYGEDDLYMIALAQETVWATKNHRWILKDGTETTNLKVGDRLWKPPTPLVDWCYEEADPVERLYWAYGYVYGDGTTLKDATGSPKCSMVRLCGKDARQFLHRFEELGFNSSTSLSLSGDIMVYTGAYKKTLPDIERDGINLVRAFVRGYLDADGAKQTCSTSVNPFVSIQATGEEAIRFIRSVFPAVGAYILRETDLTGQATNYGMRPKTVNFSLLCGMGNAPNSCFSVAGISEVPLRREHVYCLEVEEDHSFTLPGGLVTGNCSFIPLKDWHCFAELLYVLMSGTGAGFSVESEFVDELPKIKKQKGGEPLHWVVEDSTEGWCDALRMGLERWSAGDDISYDYSEIRPAGTRLRTKGGRASGPEPLRELLDFTRRILLSRQGKRIHTIDAHDIACACGKAVCVGGVRRSAEISLFDNDDELMRKAKHGEFWTHNVQRFQANNSTVFTEQPTQQQFVETLWLPLMAGGTGEPGIFNRQGIIRRMPKRRQKLLTGGNKWIGVNPCGEIALRPFEFCNLSICVARPGDTEEDLMRKVEIASIYGTLQSTLTRFSYLREEWRKNCQEERLLGVDINGWQDCELLRYGAPGRGELMRKLRDHAVEVNRIWAERLGINQSVAVTCVKPSGNSSTAVRCRPGVHPAEAAFFIRRVRSGRHDPLTKLMQDAGVPWHVENGETLENHTTVVFEFPDRAPEGAPTYDDMCAKDQLFNWLEIRRHWTEHNPSVTIRVKADEWLELGALVYEFWDDIGGVSFLPKSDHIYRLAPYEAITEEKYHELMAVFPEIPWEKLPYYEDTDNTEVAKEFACTADGCAL